MLSLIGKMNLLTKTLFVVKSISEITGAMVQELSGSLHPAAANALHQD